MAFRFNVREYGEGNIKFLTDAEANEIIHAPLLNKGSAFTAEEREIFDLNGLIPPRILTIEQQIEKVHHRYHRLGMPLAICKTCKALDEGEGASGLEKEIDIARYNFLRDLQDRNEILFYAFAHAHLEEVIPIIYTPTVGDAVIRYSRDSARFRGIFLSPNDIDRVKSVFNHFRFDRPSIAVVTDNQGILGLGDQGVGGIDIPIGKLALYTLGAGIRPWETMPLTLDVGTDNSSDLSDPYYLGYKAGRLRGREYGEFIEKFIKGITAKFPGILVQWEDFSQQSAFTILDRYRHEVLSFNDDIQGTGAVALAGILNALKHSGGELGDQRFVIYGAGAGGIGIARQIAASLSHRCGLGEAAARSRIVVLDSKGMVIDQRAAAVETYKKPFSKPGNFYRNWDLEDFSHITLMDVVENFRPTVLIGTSGRAGHFTADIIRAMAENTEHPVIFPLSNPTSSSEASPLEIYRASGGKAIVATGSPFDPVRYGNKTIPVGQGNNFFIFPGVGLGAILGKGDYISDAVFTEAAYTLADLTPDNLIAAGTVFPSFTEIRNISAHIAHSTMVQMAKEQGTPELSIDEIKSRMWKPRYHPLVRMK